jgi:peptide/nickel transport system permease protein
LWTGLRQGRTLSTGVLVAVAVPEFLTAALLAAVFGAWLGWLPQVSLVPLGGSALDAPEVLVLPVSCLALVGAGMTARVLRGVVAQVATTPYVEAARLGGVRGVRLALWHVLPAAAGPAVQVVATAVGGLVGGAVVVETVFAYPGVGQELAQAVARRDVPVVQGLALVLATVALLALVVGDVVRRLVETR